jgi:uridine kinase
MIIAVGGPSNSGKSRLANEITLAVKPKRSVVMCLDDYVYPENELPRMKGHINWEIPATIDYHKFKAELLEASRSYDFVIAEGFLVYAHEDLVPLFDKMIFIELDEKTFKERKTDDLRWGREPDWYIDHIWESYLVFGRAPEGKNVFFLKGDELWPMDRILNFLNN